MKKASIFAIACALTAAAGVAQAQVKSPLYVEGNITSINVTRDDGVKFKPLIATAIVGYDLHPNLAVEGMLGVNASKSTVTVAGNSETLKFDTSYGAFLKPRYAIDNQFEVFARLGYLSSGSKTTFSDGSSVSGRDSDFAYGLGGNYNIDKNLYATLGYMVYYKKDGIKVDGFNVGVGYRF